MRAFHNDKSVKEKYVNRVKGHALADEIIKGIYWENGKGCAVGCTIHDSSHNKYETELGIPEWLARLEDRIFEGLPNERAKTFPQEFLESINVGADLEKVKIPFLIFVVESTLDKFDHKKYPNVKTAIDGVLTELRKDKIDLEKLREARRVAAAYASAAAVYAAADAAVYAAVYAADVYAASAAAASAAVYAAVYAADAAAASAVAAASAASAARQNAYVKFADKLLELLRECA